MTISNRVILLALLSAVAACTDTKSDTDLNPAGPPMIEQVRLNASFQDMTNPAIVVQRRVFAFGTHPLAAPEEVAPNVSAAVALNNQFRVIIDELLVGNNLEEISCRINPHDPTVRTDNFDAVPIGATPDDIKSCSVADDVLHTTCKGANAVCVCENPNGCPRATVCNDADPNIPKCAVGSTCTNGICVVAPGESVGVLDDNQDGTFDDTRFIADAVQILCGANNEITVPLDLQASYWNPSGNQNKPAMGGFDALGPALVLSADGFMGNKAMPTNLPCHLQFSDKVVDKDNNRLCAPPDGDVKQNCTPGDVSAFEFHTEALGFSPGSWADGDTGVSRTDPAIFAANVPPKLPPASAITVKEGGPNGTNFTAFTVDPVANKATQIQITWTGVGLKASTEYVITFTPTVTDQWMQPLPAPQTFTFTTGT